MNDDIFVTRKEWNPTRAEMAAYLKREVEMARDNLRSLGTNGHLFTLHSQRTLALAMVPSKP